MYNVHIYFSLLAQLTRYIYIPILTTEMFINMCELAMGIQKQKFCSFEFLNFLIEINFQFIIFAVFLDKLDNSVQCAVHDCKMLSFSRRRKTICVHWCNCSEGRSHQPVLWSLVLHFKYW